MSTRPLSVSLKWLDGAPGREAGVAWGVPWKEGQLTRERGLRLRDRERRLLPVQSWPAAYWPDGSVKWSAHAAVLPAASDGWTLEAADVPAPEHPLSVEEFDDCVRVHTGALTCEIGKSGDAILKRIVSREGTETCSGARLICLKETESAATGRRVIVEETFRGAIRRVRIERSGPVQAVVRIDGRHRLDNGQSEWLPFTLRLKFYAGLADIQAAYTFYYDGNPHQDMIRGLGLRFELPMRGPLHNRHVRFAGDDGWFAEAAKSLHTRRTQGRYRELHERQLRGETVHFDASSDARFLGLLDESAVWSDFKLVQDSSRHYRISKRTKPGCCWLKAADGSRAGGLAYAGGEGGGLAVGLRNFWQKCPSGFEIRRTAQPEASLTVWFWSPDGPTMDMRHYDTETHVESAYEGAEELRATPYGVANTSELLIFCLTKTPSEDQLNALLAAVHSPPLLVCEPAYYHAARAFGLWSLPDRSAPAKAAIEDRLDGILAFYREEIERRDWYGFWDYGDYMHSYDPVRHVWNYDLGGCAWQNTELVPNMWLWVSFLRSGRADVFRMAEAMTRHTSEVDVYHFGEYAGLGSRHNVVHWGCGCKEARIAMAGLHRYYYYLTTDERTGDILDEVKDADYSTVTLDPMRAYHPKDEHPTHIRIGPDWAAFSSNWMTRWERFEDTAYRDKIAVGLECVKKTPFRLLSGPTYGYDPKTGVLTPMGVDNWGRHLAICMGGPQVWFELADMLKDPSFEDMLAEFGWFYLLLPEEKTRYTEGRISPDRFHHPVLGAGIAAYGAWRRNDREAAERTWAVLLENPYARTDLRRSAVERRYLSPLPEIGWINTNEASQWSLNAILALELIPDSLPEAYGPKHGGGEGGEGHA
ncbi:hypothetical protein ACFQWB_04770 [Paenibacillus thermoaerophilus]|uniref:Tat pathway signal sequence domain protein n=1 Tax=Paenibacillus thermoaerophilus TaxID=1215385 RepID=A0ABW2V384_9BACL|nr:hypothetical protein [Paenibacillus thermoaerophilus]TMV17406.1 hypothetical protein FE781_06640 [Paenibacillus thermoaerophilus]